MENGQNYSSTISKNHDRNHVNSKELRKFFQEWPKPYLCYDLRLTIFSSALYSLKTTTVLKPCPNDFYNEDQQIQRDELINAFETISGPINQMVTSSDEITDQKRKTVKLVHWILSNGPFDLREVKLDQINPKAREILEDNFKEQRSYFVRPNFIFEIIFPSDRSKSKRFAALRSKYCSFYAFHGSPMENFHLILHNGLIYSLNKRSMLDVGTYLSSKIEVALLFSPFTKNHFRGSRLGKKLSCVAMCEVIDHPDIEVKKKRDIYYIVANDELLRVSYLLLYSSDSATNHLHHLNVSSIPSGNQESIETSTTLNMAFIIIIMLFLFIGLFISKSPEM